MSRLADLAASHLGLGGEELHDGVDAVVAGPALHQSVTLALIDLVQDLGLQVTGQRLTVDQRLSAGGGGGECPNVRQEE